MSALQNTLYCAFFPSPFRGALIFHTFFQCFNTCSTQHGLHIPHWAPLSGCPSLLEVTQATQGLCSPPCRLPEARRDEGRPLCEEMIFSVLRRTLQIISSNLSNGPEMLLPLSCNGDRWLAGQTGASQTPIEGANKPPRAHTQTLAYNGTPLVAHVIAGNCLFSGCGVSGYP